MEARLRFPHRECTEYSTFCLESVGKASRTQDLRLRRRSRSFAQRSFARRSLLHSAAAHASLTLHSAAGQRGVQRQAGARRKFRQFWRVVIDFEHWRAASAALCAKRESEENFAILTPEHVDFEPRGCCWREMRPGRLPDADAKPPEASGCGCGGVRGDPRCRADDHPVGPNCVRQSAAIF